MGDTENVRNDAPTAESVETFKRNWGYAQSTRRHFYRPFQRKLDRLNFWSNPSFLLALFMFSFALSSVFHLLKPLNEFISKPSFALMYFVGVGLCALFASRVRHRLEEDIIDQWRRAHPHEYELLTWGEK